ncbi:hypothetical protein PMG71_09820 [Roseofilum sp. BLCC_M154]|uniref:Uncharacterized protein n=1 Tax=Roseofilum acuticapitatum BLCC-M154 TaxID=3022444 RepID=A0ABT7AS44_9CYAN|nr:hypothetical protein [Roseofilum acuticapitatum]MDJ1169724.1 hypothetical protein [Roseofilum acuticapitatum BLCC-M154]
MMSSNLLNKEISLSTEEKELLESVEKEEWESIENVTQEIERYQAYASYQISQQNIEVTLSVDQG